MKHTVIFGILGGVVVLGTSVVAGQYFLSPAHTSSPMAAMMHSDTAMQHRFLLRLAKRYPRLLTSHGMVTPEDVGLTTRQADTHGTLHRNHITGVNALWRQTATYLQTRSRQLHLANVPPSVWQSGFRAAAQDVMMAAGNDPLQAVMTAGPGTVAKFWQLEQAAYAGPHGKLTQPHWITGIAARPQRYPQGPSVKIYTITHEVPGAPAPVVLMRVPVTLRKVGLVPQSAQSVAVRSVTQNGVIIIALTHTGSHWQWWTEQLTLHAASTQSHA